MNQRPHYTDKNSLQTLQEGLDEYYALNPHLTSPDTQPQEFGKILLAHDIGHVIYGCDTGMYDELRILPLFWWTSDCTFSTFREMRKTNKSVIDVMYNDLIRDKSVLWLYSSIIKVIPQLVPTLISTWFKTRQRQKLVPFLDFEPLLDRSLLDIRREFDLLPLFH